MLVTESEPKTESVLNLLTLSPARLHLFRRPLGDRSCLGDRPGLGDREDTSGEGDRNFDSVNSSDTSVVSTVGSCSLIEPNEWSRCCTLTKHQVLKYTGCCSIPTHRNI